MGRSQVDAVEVRLLGGLRVLTGGMRQRLAPNESRLVAYLAVAARAVSREIVAENLWNHAGIDRAAASLRTTLWRLGRDLPTLVHAERSHLSLDDSVPVDAVAARERARRIVADPEVAAATNIRSLEQDVLPELYDDWAILEHERYRQQRLHALEAVAQACAERGWWGRAIDAATTVVGADPLRESAHRTLIAVHLAEGNVAEAARAYERCRDLLRDELGVDPSPQLQQMVARRAFAPVR